MRVGGRATARAVRAGEPPSDVALLEAIAARDQAAFAALYDRHSLHAYHLARKLLGEREAAEDVVQEVFLRVWRRAATFDPARGAAVAWLLSSVHHAAISRTRGRWARERQALPLDERCALSAPDDPGAEVEAAERAGLVRAGLATLPAPQREAVELYYFEGLTCAELATRTAAAVGTAKGPLRLARAHLRAALTPVAAALD